MNFFNHIVTCSFYFLLFPVIFLSLNVGAQETNSQVSGKITSDKKENLVGATVTVTHQPTKNIFIAQSRPDGYFYLFNLKPGGPYTVTASYTGYETIKKENLYFDLDRPEYDNELLNFILKPKEISLAEVIVTGNILSNNKTGIETNISNQKLLALPSISRNLQDYIRTVPQAKVYADGSFSLAGQNTRFNAFFIDGANNKDIQGIAQNGMNGGFTGSPPISIDAIEQIKVLLAPYDVQYGNFTGGSVNAITRSGTNEIKGSAWYYFRNEQLAGRSPVPVEKPGSPGTFERPQLSHFFNQTAGLRLGGPIVKNKLFYFILAEKQSEIRPQPFDFAEYQGNSNLQQLNALADRLRNDYKYEPGSFLESSDKLNAARLMFKADWNPSTKNKLTLTYRYNLAERSAAATSAGTAIAFGNSNFFLPTHTHSGTFEWKGFPSRHVSNRLLFTVTNESDDRKWKGEPFPNVNIADGAGSIRFGSGPNTMLSIFKATEFTVSDILKFVRHQHTLSTGIDFNFSKLNDIIIQNYFGSYTFSNLNDFMNGASPIRLQRSFSLLDEPDGDNTLAGARYKTLRFGIFFNDEIIISSKLKLNIGLRADRNSITTDPHQDKFFKDSAIKIISKYYNREAAIAGQVMNPDLQISPRIGFTYKIPRGSIIIRGGGGIFTGHILNIWSSLLHRNNGVSIGGININPQQYGLKFNPDPYNQPTPRGLGINPANAKGELNLISKDFKYPAVFRTSFSVAKNLKSAWTFSVEGILTKNIHETRYTNINILPPTKTSSLPDARNVYSLNSSPDKISSPYTQIFLLSNNHKQRGSSYSLSFVMDKQFSRYFSLNAGYTFGKSKVFFETSGGNSLYSSQWMQTETVNGKNFATLSASNLNPGHRVFAGAVKKFSYAKSKSATTISVFYNGQSGSPYSYVNIGSIINDNGNIENYDLMYIPTVAELDEMIFIPATVSATTYSPQQQRHFLNEFIEQDKYLRRHRGEFAERNGARLPFTNIVDLRIQQDFKIKIKKKETGFSITYDVFNFTNMLNKNWGRIYFMADDKFPLIQFAGYANTATLTPQYRFTPLKGTPYSIQSRTLPGNSARWISQLGFRINFD